MSTLTLDLELPPPNLGIVNIASVPHRSPFRYPGGKTWLVPRVRQWLASTPRPQELIEPFAGGAIVGLSVLFENLVDQLLLVELDEDVAAVWSIVLNGCRQRVGCRYRKLQSNGGQRQHCIGYRAEKHIR